MADDKPEKKPRVRKPAPTMREQAETARGKADKPKRTRKARQAAGRVTRPLVKAHHFGQKTYFLPMPDNRVGRFLNKRRYFVPKYFRDSWAELKLVTWPSRRESWRLTGAVFVFAVVFGLCVTFVDKILDKVVRDILLK